MRHWNIMGEIMGRAEKWQRFGGWGGERRETFKENQSSDSGGWEKQRGRRNIMRREGTYTTF